MIDTEPPEDNGILTTEDMTTSCSTFHGLMTLTEKFPLPTLTDWSALPNDLRVLSFCAIIQNPV